jgi:hypothetical protein
MRCCKEIEKKKAGICGLIKKTGKCLGKERRGALVSQKDFPRRRRENAIKRFAISASLREK